MVLSLIPLFIKTISIVLLNSHQYYTINITMQLSTLSNIIKPHNNKHSSIFNYSLTHTQQNTPHISAPEKPSSQPISKAASPPALPNTPSSASEAEATPPPAPEDPAPPHGESENEVNSATAIATTNPNRDCSSEKLDGAFASCKWQRVEGWCEWRIRYC